MKKWETYVLLQIYIWSKIFQSLYEILKKEVYNIMYEIFL